jgi:hypothetical protein
MVAIPGTESPRPIWQRLALPLVGFACGLAAAGLLVVGDGGRAGQAQAPSPEAALQETLLNRIGQLEARLTSLQRDLARQPANQTAQGDRFVAAALLLQASIATPRPWLREYQAMAELATPAALPPALAEVLLSHAGRGLPTEAELRERFAALAPQLIARAPRQGDALDQTLSLVRGAAAGIGLAAPPPPTDQEQAIAGVAYQLRRGNLAAAVADAAALDASLQPLLAGWLAQARARLAVEQAVQETLLRALARPNLPPNLPPTGAPG